MRSEYKNDSRHFRGPINVHRSSTIVFRRMFGECHFGEFNGAKINFLDAMAGRGELGKSIASIYANTEPNKIPLKVYYNDAREAPLSILQSEGQTTIKMDICEIDNAGNKFEVVAVRYGLKDLAKEQIPIALKAIYNTLRHGGRLVIGDMTARSEAGQKSVIAIQSAKLQFAGQNTKTEGTCFIPLIEEWPGLLKDAGFIGVGKPAMFTSSIETSQWKKHFGQNKDVKSIIRKMNEAIYHQGQVNTTFLKEFNVRFNGELVLIDFPIMVISGTKP
jgi:ubiquinone/menaquinone biosynthesis C-methylase UbiE